MSKKSKSNPRGAGRKTLPKGKARVPCNCRIHPDTDALIRDIQRRKKVGQGRAIDILAGTDDE